MSPSKSYLNRLFLFIIYLAFCIIAQAKSVYVINENYIYSELRAYKIDGNSLVYQTDYSCVNENPVGIAIDESEYGAFLFVTMEWTTSCIEIVDAKTMQYVDSVFPCVDCEPTGIVMDKSKDKVYFMHRYSNHLYILTWDAQNRTLINDLPYPYYIELQGMKYGDPNGAFGIALDENNGRLYISDHTDKIKYYDTNDWSKIGDVNISCKAISVAVDVNRQLLYYGSMGDYGDGDPNLYQYNLSSGTGQEVNIGASVAGIAVDQQSSLVYLTTYGTMGDTNYPSPPQDRLMIYDYNLVKKPWESNDIGNPAGVCVPDSNVEYRPPLLHLEKVDINEPNSVIPGDYITYMITYGPDGADHNNVVMTDYLPYEVDYEDTLDPNYDAENHIYTWLIGSLDANAQNNSVTLTVKVNQGAEPNGVIKNYCDIKSNTAYTLVDVNTNVGPWQPDSAIIYVNSYSLCSPGTGMSWKFAYRDFKAALDRARAGYGSEIWVAAGVYTSSTSGFNLVNGIPVYGHFTGNESSLEQRNFKDLYKETFLNAPGISYDVIIASSVHEGTILDGFTIRGASGSPHAGIKVDNSNLLITNCLITNNYYGIKTTNSSFTIADSVIKNNIYGGINANLSNNSSLAETKLANNIIRNNLNWGVNFSNVNSRVVIINNVVHNNSSGISVSSISGSTPEVIVRNNTIGKAQNTGFYISNTISATISNCIFWCNDTNLSPTSRHATYSRISDSNAANHNINTDPCFVDIDSNNFHLQPTSPCVDKGDPAFNDFNELDIDGECRIIYGDSDLRVDIGADELFRPKADFNNDDIVNFCDFAILADKWQEPNSDKSLDADNDIDIDDLNIFCNEWLWIAPWSPLYSMPFGESDDSGMDMMAEGPTESPVLAEEMPAEVVADEQLQDSGETTVNREQMEEFIAWTQELWESSPEIRALISQADYERFLALLNAQLGE